MEGRVCVTLPSPQWDQEQAVQVGGGRWSGKSFLLSSQTSGEGTSSESAWVPVPLRSQPLRPPHDSELLFLQLLLPSEHTHSPQRPPSPSAGKRGFPKTRTGRRWRRRRRKGEGRRRKRRSLSSLKEASLGGLSWGALAPWGTILGCGSSGWHSSTHLLLRCPALPSTWYTGVQSVN